MKQDSIELLINNYNKQYSDNMFEFYDFSNNKFYIPIKRNLNWQFNHRQIRKMNLNNYLFSVYCNQSDFSLEKFITIFINSLTDVEISILQHRLKFIWNYFSKSLIEISTQYWLTRERIRQLEFRLLKTTKDTFLLLWGTQIWINYWKIFIENNNIQDIWILDYTLNWKDYINWTFLSFANSLILWNNYEKIFLNSDNEISSIAMIYKKWLLDKRILKVFFWNVDNIFYEKRPEDVVLKKEQLMSLIVKNNINEYLSNNLYEYWIIKYISYAYNVFQINWYFTLPKNKKDLKYLVNNELEELSFPIHYKDMFEIVNNKYPEYNRNYWKVHSALMKYGKNVWNWLYVKNSHNMKWWKIRDIAEECLIRNWWPMYYSELLEYILNNKKVKKWSVDALLFDKEWSKIFEKIEWIMIWLKKWNL